MSINSLEKKSQKSKNPFEAINWKQNYIVFYIVEENLPSFYGLQQFYFPLYFFQKVV